jgi:hypothetical protein
MKLKSFAAALALSAVASSADAQSPTTTAKPEKHIDSLWNGALIGAGVGAVGAWIFTRANCGPRGFDDECSLIAGPIGTAIFVPAGAIGGAIIDRLINKTLPPGAKAHTSIAPLLSQQGGRKKAGVALKVKIKF